jgi:lipopolysaccharide cholinephosphotransferase
MSGRDALGPEELRKLQAVMLDMLVEVDGICRKHGIKYSIVAGTLLGAVRHKGFIPWDDDADIAMFRSEYEKFRDVCAFELDADKYFFQDNTTDRHYRWGYGRIRRRDSEFVRRGQEHLKMRTGIFLDIFPGDKIPNLWPLRALHSGYCWALRKILYAETGKITGKSGLTRTIYKALGRIPPSWVFGRLDGLQRFWNKRETKFNRTLTFPPRAGLSMGVPNRWLENLTELEFEGHAFYALRDWDEYLRWRFGDYMTPPPQEKRHWHPASKVVLPEEYR